MANAEKLKEIAVQGYGFEKWCCEKFGLIPSRFSAKMWKTYGVTRKKLKSTNKTCLDAYDPESKYEIEIKSTGNLQTFTSWKEGKPKWCKQSPPQRTMPDFLLIVGLIQGKDIKSWIIIRIQRYNGKEKIVLLREG